MNLRVEWLPGAERELLYGVSSLETIESIAAAVQRFADSFGDPTFDAPAERIGDHPTGVRLHVGGRRVVTMFIDLDERVLVVSALGQEPDPDADPDADPEPDAFEDDE